MALSRISCSANMAKTFSKSSYAGGARSLEQWSRRLERLHRAAARFYPEAPRLRLPANVSEISNAETSRFGPERTRDLAAPEQVRGDFGARASLGPRGQDARLHSYDCQGAVSLNGAMQSNVPQPFRGGARATHLNMPGGQWARDGKYLAEVMRRSHFTVWRALQPPRDGPVLQAFISAYSTSTSAKKVRQDDLKPIKDPLRGLSKKDKLKVIARDYGKTVIVFHVGISLLSLGICYSLVSSGLDMSPVIEFISDLIQPEKNREQAKSELVSHIMSGGSTFLVAYGVHKLFAPMRISLTFGLTPLIVRYLRTKGIIKPPKVRMSNKMAESSKTS